jgi:hypothetical protein
VPVLHDIPHEAAQALLAHDLAVPFLVAHPELGAGRPQQEQLVLEVPLAQEILLALAALELEPRRLRDVETPGLDDGDHVAEEERQEQGDVGAVDVGVGHQDDLVIAEPRHVEPSGPIPVPSAAIISRISWWESTLS